MSWEQQSKDKKGIAEGQSPSPTSTGSASSGLTIGPKKNADEELEKGFSDDQVKEFIIKAQNRPKSSPVCAVVYGFDGTCKSGIILDSRTEKERMEGKKIFVFDFDDSCGPIAEEYWKEDLDNGNIVIFDPTTLKESGEIDYEQTYYKTLSTIKYLLRHEGELNLATVALDGIDTMLKYCENLMRVRDLQITMDEHIKEQRMWAGRNRYYHTVMLLLKKVNARKFYTTHLKGEYSYVNKKLMITGYNPSWQNKTPDMMSQKIEMTIFINEKEMKTPDMLSRIKPSDSVVVRAMVRKAKGKIQLENTEYDVATFAGKDSKWYGLIELIKKLEGME